MDLSTISLAPVYPVGLSHYLLVGAILFCIGMYGALARRNAVAVLLAVELMLNGVNLTLVGFARYQAAPALTGQVFAAFIMMVAAAEAAVGLAIVIAIYRLRRSVQVDEINAMQG